ncbi:MAG: hypothetical protein ACR2LJ_10020 [Acidimicrobiales bacterium]
MRRVVLAVAATGMLAAASCSSSKAGVTAVGPTVATAPETTTTTDPYAIPPVIDVAYVNRVLAGLDAAVGDVVRFVVKTHPAPHEITLRLKPLYNDRALAAQLEFFHQDAAENYKGYRSDPANEKSSTLEVIAASSRCIFARVTRDYQPVSANPDVQLSEQWVGLIPLTPERDPNHVNTTGWSYVYDGFQEPHNPPPNPCGVSS